MLAVYSYDCDGYTVGSTFTASDHEEVQPERRSDLPSYRRSKKRRCHGDRVMTASMFALLHCASFIAPPASRPVALAPTLPRARVVRLCGFSELCPSVPSSVIEALAARGVCQLLYCACAKA